jgi:hypothetical protein
MANKRRTQRPISQTPLVFLSYSSEDSFEANLLQTCIEIQLADCRVTVWTFERDQAKDEGAIADSLREKIRNASAMIIVVSQFTLRGGASQWMELAYADAFGVPIFVLLHHLSFKDLKRARRGVPPILLQRECTPAVSWLQMTPALRSCCVQAKRAPGSDGPGRMNGTKVVTTRRRRP